MTQVRRDRQPLGSAATSSHTRAPATRRGPQRPFFARAPFAHAALLHTRPLCARAPFAPHAACSPCKPCLPGSWGCRAHRETAPTQPCSGGSEVPMSTLQPKCDPRLSQANLAHGQCKYRLLGMKPVLGFVPQNRMRTIDYLTGDLFAAVSRQAVHDDAVGVGQAD